MSTFFSESSESFIFTPGKNHKFIFVIDFVIGLFYPADRKHNFIWSYWLIALSRSRKKTVFFLYLLICFLCCYFLGRFSSTSLMSLAIFIVTPRFCKRDLTARNHGYSCIYIYLVSFFSQSNRWCFFLSFKKRSFVVFVVTLR